MRERKKKKKKSEEMSPTVLTVLSPVKRFCSPAFKLKGLLIFAVMLLCGLGGISFHAVVLQIEVPGLQG